MKPPAGTTDVAILTSLPFPIHLPDTIVDGKFEQIRPEVYVAGEPPAGIHLIRRLRTQTDIATPLEMEGGDPFGRFSTTDVQVRFNLARSPEIAELEPRQLVDLAVEALNRLVAHYRDIAGQPLIRKVSAGDLVHFKVRYLKSGVPLQDLAYATGHGPLRGRAKDEAEAIDARVRDRLQRVEPPDLFRELELRMHQLYGERDYRGAVIEAAILFEAWLKVYLRKQFSRQGLSEGDIEAKFKNKERLHTADHIAKTLVKEALGLDFGITTQYTDWRRRTADVRNGLVHGSRHSVSEEEAIKGIEAVYAARTCIMAPSKQAPDLANGG